MNIETGITYVFVPVGAVLGAAIFKDVLHTMLLSIFGAVIGFLVRLVLDHYYNKYKTYSTSTTRRNGKANKRKN